MTSWEPETWIGTSARSCWAASTAAPERSLPTLPSRERVPSANITRLQPCSNSALMWAVESSSRPRPSRATGTVPKNSDTVQPSRRLA